MKSGEYDHQTTSVKEWISSFRNLRIRRPTRFAAEALPQMMETQSPTPPALQTPSQMQQVLSTASLKELQRQGSIITSSKWSE
eukprot:1048718-Amphidinium_carterae.1